jgi:hypothetical protein
LATLVTVTFGQNPDPLFGVVFSIQYDFDLFSDSKLKLKLIC